MLHYGLRAYMDAGMRTCTYIYTCRFLRSSIHAHKHMYTHTHTHTHTYIHIYTHVQCLRALVISAHMWSLFTRPLYLSLARS